MRASLDAGRVENTGSPRHMVMNTTVSLRRKQGATIGCIVLTFVLLGFSSAASAMYKCIGEDGARSFQDAPCQTAVHENSNDPVIGTQAPIQIEEPKRNVLPTSQYVQVGTEQNIDSDQTDTGDATVIDQTSAKGKGSFLDFLPFLVVYLGFSAMLGWWASNLKRSFWNWFLLSLIFTPSLIFCTLLFIRLFFVHPSSFRGQNS